MKLFAALIARDLRLALAGSAWAPLAFFLLVAVLYPFGVGPDAALLSRTGGGVIWVAALLAALLPVDRLLGPDAEAGVLDQLAVRGASEELVAAAKFAAHWLSFGPPLMIAAVPAGALLKLDADALARIETGLLIGTPALAALGVMAAALTLGLRRAGALSGLLILPLAVPVLIFGAGSLAPFPGSALMLLGASSLFLCGLAPFVAGAALRAARD